MRLMLDVNVLLDAQAQAEIGAAFKRFSFGNLSGVMEALGERYSPGQCRVFRAAMQNRQRERYCQDPEGHDPDH